MKHSEWFKGFLYAEQMYKDGYRPAFPFYLTGYNEWRAGSCSFKLVNHNDNFEYGRGVVDYIQYRQERLQQC